VSGRSKDQDLLDKLAAWIQAPDVEAAQTNGHTTPLSRGESSSSTSSAGVSDEQVLEACRRAENAMKFEALYDRGDVRAYHGGDDSVADLALLGILSFYTQDETQLERLFSSSALGRREKWRRRDDYRKRTIGRALAGAGEVYDWDHRGGVSLGPRLVSSPSSPLGKTDDNDTNNEPEAASGLADLPYKGSPLSPLAIRALR
jgi:primase-polymerase (primpol)-like protein